VDALIEAANRNRWRHADQGTGGKWIDIGLSLAEFLDDWLLCRSSVRRSSRCESDFNEYRRAAMAAFIMPTVTHFVRAGQVWLVTMATHSRRDLGALLGAGRLSTRSIAGMRCGLAVSGVLANSSRAHWENSLARSR
jgi:hypothetical protein